MSNRTNNSSVNGFNSFRLINISGNGEYAKYAPATDTGFALVREQHISALCLDTALVCKSGRIAYAIALCADGVTALSSIKVDGAALAKIKEGGEWRERNADERALTLEKLYAHIGEDMPAAPVQTVTRSRKASAPVVPAIPAVAQEKKPGRITRKASAPVPAPVAVAAETPETPSFQAQIDAIAGSVAALAGIVGKLAEKTA